MIEIASPATPQLSSLLPPRRRRSPNDAPGASREHGRREKYDPIADREHSLATLYPSKSSLIVIPTARQPTPATLKSPLVAAAATPFRLAVSFLGGFRTPALSRRTAMVNEGPASENLHNSGPLATRQKWKFPRHRRGRPGRLRSRRLGQSRRDQAAARRLMPKLRKKALRK